MFVLSGPGWSAGVDLRRRNAQVGGLWWCGSPECACGCPSGLVVSRVRLCLIGSGLAVECGRGVHRCNRSAAAGVDGGRPSGKC